VKYFYKITDGKVKKGSGIKVRSGFVEYTKGNEPQELIDILARDEAQAKTKAQQKAFNDAVQNHLDTKAQSLRYDNINAIGKYVGYENDFQAEAEALGAWASSCWKVAGQTEADVQAGVRTMPTVDEVLAELPSYGE